MFRHEHTALSKPKLSKACAVEPRQLIEYVNTFFFVQSPRLKENTNVLHINIYPDAGIELATPGS